MINIVFLALPIVLLVVALYWARGRGGHRPAGTWSLCVLLVAFAGAFAAYAPIIESLEDAATLHLSRLISNSFTLTAAASVLSLLLSLNHGPDEARRRMQPRLVLLGLAVLAMASLFFLTGDRSVWDITPGTEDRLQETPLTLSLYSMIYILYLGFAVGDCLRQTWRRSCSTPRASQRVGLRVTAAGCLFALLYTTYKTVNVISQWIGRDLIPGGRQCTTLVTPMDCAFSVTAPAISVFLIAVGLTLPALLWPISELRRRRWERRSFDALGWLWHELTTAAPDVIFATSTGGDESDFLLHRRVIEINDGILALRPYRSLQVQQAAEHALAARQHRNPTDRDAMVEAAVLADAVRSARHGWSLSSQEAPPAPGTTSREGKLQAETEWLLKVARAYPRSGAVRATARKQDLSGSP